MKNSKSNILAFLIVGFFTARAIRAARYAKSFNKRSKDPALSALIAKTKDQLSHLNDVEQSYNAATARSDVSINQLREEMPEIVEAERNYTSPDNIMGDL